MTIEQLPQSWKDVMLTIGSHSDPRAGLCLMEAVALMSGAPHTDRPTCTSPVLSAFARTWNDDLRSDADRDLLVPYIPLLIGTAGDGPTDERRAKMAGEWLLRTYTPAWLRLTGLADLIKHVHPKLGISDVRRAEAAARDSDRASGIPIPFGARNPGRDHARDHIRASAGYAARHAVTSARSGGTGATYISADRVTSAAVSASISSAIIVAMTTPEALEPMVVELQEGAHDLLLRMIAA